MWNVSVCVQVIVYIIALAAAGLRMNLSFLLYLSGILTIYVFTIIKITVLKQNQILTNVLSCKHKAVNLSNNVSVLCQTHMYIFCNRWNSMYLMAVCPQVFPLNIMLRLWDLLFKVISTLQKEGGVFADSKMRKGQWNYGPPLLYSLKLLIPSLQPLVKRVLVQKLWVLYPCDDPVGCHPLGKLPLELIIGCE